MMAEKNELFASLCGEPMNGVSFVMDYVEFHFNGQVIRALSNPEVQIGSNRTSFPDPGSRDALCSLIGETVVEIQVDEESSVRLLFTSGSRLSVPLGPSHRVGPEALHFMKDGQFVVIW
jgi:hypothetical protein